MSYLGFSILDHVDPADRNPTEEKFKQIQNIASMQCFLAKMLDTETIDSDKYNSDVDFQDQSHLLFEAPRNMNEVIRYPLKVRILLIAPTTAEWVDFLRDFRQSLSATDLVFFKIGAYQRRRRLDLELSYLKAEDEFLKNYLTVSILCEMRRNALYDIPNYGPLMYLNRELPLKVQLYMWAASLKLDGEQTVLVKDLLNMNSRELKVTADEVLQVVLSFNEFAKANNEQSLLLTHNKFSKMPPVLAFNIYYMLDNASIETSRHDWYVYLYNNNCMEKKSQILRAFACLANQIFPLSNQLFLQLGALLPSVAPFLSPETKHLLPPNRHSVSSKMYKRYLERKIHSFQFYIPTGTSSYFYAAHAFGLRRFEVSGASTFTVKVDSNLRGTPRAFIRSIMPDQMFFFSNKLYQLDYLLRNDTLQYFAPKLTEMAMSLRAGNATAVNRTALLDRLFYFTLTPFHKAAQSDAEYEQEIAYAALLRERAEQVGVNPNSVFIHGKLSFLQLRKLECIFDVIESYENQQLSPDDLFQRMCIRNYIQPATSPFTISFSGHIDGFARNEMGVNVACPKKFRMFAIPTAPSGDLIQPSNVPNDELCEVEGNFDGATELYDLRVSGAKRPLGDSDGNSEAESPSPFRARLQYADGENELEHESHSGTNFDNEPALGQSRWGSFNSLPQLLQNMSSDNDMYFRDYPQLSSEDIIETPAEYLFKDWSRAAVDESASQSSLVSSPKSLFLLRKRSLLVETGDSGLHSNLIWAVISVVLLSCIFAAFYRKRKF